MNRRDFMDRAAAAAAASFTIGMTASQKADAMEDEMIRRLDAVKVVEPWACDIGGRGNELRTGELPEQGAFAKKPVEKGPPKPFLMGNDPRLPLMPEKPTLVDFFKYRFAPARHLLQSAALAKRNGHDEKHILAALLHDIGASTAFRSDHGYWGAQIVAPYVSEEISWAIRAHQALRFFPDPSVGYEYPEAYRRYFGANYQPEPYVVKAYEQARRHKWYMTARLITMNDLYAFDPDANPQIEDFADIIGRHFKQPKEGLGFDGSPVAHMWRTVIWPNNFL